MASLGNLYPNLPGMLVEFKDGGSSLRFDSNDVNTDSMIILGTAVDGPYMEPVAVSIDTAELVFGSDTNSNGTPNGSTLIHAFKQAYEAGCRDIRLMRISGSAATNVIETAAVSTADKVRIDEEDIEYIAGNDQTVIKLNVSMNGVADDIRVYAKGKRVAASFFSVDDSENTVTLKADSCDAGSTIEVKYKELIEHEHTKEYKIVDLGDGKIGFDMSDLDDYKELYKDTGASNAVDKKFYKVVDGKVIIITEDSSDISFVADRDLVLGNKVTVKYTTIETNSKSVKKMAATSYQEVHIANTPVDGTEPILYVNGAKVLDKDAFNYASGVIYVDKSKFKKGQSISVSYFVLDTKDDVKSTITLESYFAGEVYNEGEVTVEKMQNSTGQDIGVKVTITKPDSKLAAGEAPQVYTSIDYPTFGLLVEAINEKNGTYKASTLDEDELTENLVVSSAYFSDGDDGLNLSKDELFECLSGIRDTEGYIVKQGAYQLLENYQVDTVVPVGVYADDVLMDKHQNFAYELALFCAISSYKNKTTNGAIAMKPLRDTSLAGIQKHAKYLANYYNEYYMLDATGSPIVDQNGDKMDLGKFISVVAGPGIMFNHAVKSLREANPAVMYMAYNSTLQSQSAPTNKRVTGSTGLKYNFSNSQLNDIVGNRMVTFGLKYSSTGQALGGAFCIDGPTAARPGSEYARLTTIKVIRDVADAMREVADPYIGEANTIEQRNALSAAISKRLDLLVENGVILDYSFNLVATAQDQLLGQASLELGIVAPQELRKITSIIGLKNS